jgi:hypothetical protein
MNGLVADGGVISCVGQSEYATANARQTSALVVMGFRAKHSFSTPPREDFSSNS